MGLWHTQAHDRGPLNAVKIGGNLMKAAVFREVNVPMEIEEISVSKPGPREVLDSHYGSGHLPQRYAFLERQLSGQGAHGAWPRECWNC